MGQLALVWLDALVIWGGHSMPSNISMTYGSYSFDPVPMVDISKDYLRTGDTQMIGVRNDMTLKGYIVDLTGGLPALVEEQREMRDAFSSDGDYFSIACSGDEVLECYPQVIGIDFDAGDSRWTNLMPYTIRLSYDEEPVKLNISDDPEDSGNIYPPSIRNATETWNVEILDEDSYYEFAASGVDSNPWRLKVAHQISAEGGVHYESAGVLAKQPWEQAKDFCESLLGWENEPALGSGILNFDRTDEVLCNNMRSITVDEKAGTYGVTETWIVHDPSSQAGGSGNAIENFTVEVRKNAQDSRNRVGVQGSIQGMETRAYGSVPGDFDITTTKYAAASGYWESVKGSSRIYPRANTIAQNNGITLNVDPLVNSVAHSPANGTISYSYEYDDRPSNCIPGSITESITVTDNDPTDVFAQIMVLGRAGGPILQDLSTVTAATREINIDLLMSGNDTCPNVDFSSFMSTNNPSSNVDAIVASAYANFAASYGQVFKHADSESWDPIGGRFRRNVGWTASTCA